jgi:hypothetical protein
MGHDVVFWTMLIMALLNLLPLGFVVSVFVSSCRSR